MLCYSSCSFDHHGVGEEKKNKTQTSGDLMKAHV